MIIGSGYFGCSSTQTSTANVEIIQQHKPSSYTNFSAYKLSFMNNLACQIKINNGDAIYLKANQGFSCDYYDFPISSFIIVTASVEYNYLGAY